MYLSPKSYARAVETAAFIRAAEKPIRILRSLSWDPEIGRSFVKSGATQLPIVGYPAFDGSQSREFIAKARAIGQGDHPVFEWLMRIADKLEMFPETTLVQHQPGVATHRKYLAALHTVILVQREYIGMLID